MTTVKFQTLLISAQFILTLIQNDFIRSVELQSFTSATKCWGTKLGNRAGRILCKYMA